MFVKLLENVVAVDSEADDGEDEPSPGGEVKELSTR